MENMKSSYNSHKFKISAPTWNGKFELPNGSYSVSDIQDYFVYIFKKNIMKILITHQYENSKSVPHFELTEVVLVQ